ncbi:hypothetical protein HanOQP8_Chr04g0165781 [Helianthus annuus]|nr:hypothetical protein HanLR1_Chr04g0158751 [Helianthus annuus]KAJ0762844.1 hypothetical protein HanOQP8_Chr04g0165781 [Helianthus annuus]KAJ0933131.1 hypothetical protein HanPSC8_Chr04g0181471 [Helianthus annuus]
MGLLQHCSERELGLLSMVKLFLRTAGIVIDLCLFGYLVCYRYYYAITSLF